MPGLSLDESQAHSKETACASVVYSLYSMKEAVFRYACLQLGNGRPRQGGMEGKVG